MEAQSGTSSMTKRSVTAMIDEGDISKLEEIAQRQRASLAWVIRDAVADYLAKESGRSSGMEAGSQEVRSS